MTESEYFADQKDLNKIIICNKNNDESTLIYVHSGTKYYSELRCVIVSVGNSEQSHYLFLPSLTFCY